MQSISREEFEKHFKDVNASWALEGAELNEIEKELLFMKLNNGITEEEYNRFILECIQSDGQFQ